MIDKTTGHKDHFPATVRGRKNSWIHLIQEIALRLRLVFVFVFTVELSNFGP